MKVYVLNMPRQTGRRKAMEQALKKNKFPSDHIHIWSKQDECSTGYEKNSDLIKAAIADGFPIFQRFMDERNIHKHIPIGVIGHTWSCFRIWWEAEGTALPFMVLHDDHLPIKPYDYYVQLVETAEKHSKGNWKIISLTGIKAYFFWERKVDKPVRNKEWTRVGNDGMLVKGLPRICGDTGYILSTAGLDWLRRHFEKRFWFLETLFDENKDEPDTYTASEQCLESIQNEYPSSIHFKNGKNRYPEKLG